jgi:hypothetical protein
VLVPFVCCVVDYLILDYFNNKELLVSNFYYYQNYLLNKPEEYNHISLLNRTLEIFFITKTKNDTNNYTSSIERDNWYNTYLSNNPNAIELLTANQDKIDWNLLSHNPNIYTLDYEQIALNFQSFREEIIERALDPDRIHRLSVIYNFKFKDWFDNN